MADHFVSLHLLLIDGWPDRSGLMWRGIVKAAIKLARIADEDNQ